MRRSIGPAFVLAAGFSGALATCGSAESAAREDGFEASGVARLGDELVFVDDDVEDAAFHVQVHGPVGAQGGALAIDRDNARRVPLDDALQKPDLESIDVLDGELFVLSEERARLLGPGGGRRYHERYRPLGHRGLEGLALREDGSGETLVAVLWEGGYLVPRDLPRSLRTILAHRAAEPVVLRHVLNRKKDKVEAVELLTGRIGTGVVEGQRFRAPDLVWHELASGDPCWIVLLGSTGDPLGPEDERYAHAWLQRFELDGQPLGAPLDLKAWLVDAGLEDLVEHNWEGLAWWEAGETLVLVNDAGRKGETHALFVPVPPDWIARPERDDVERIHADALVFDGHNDLPWAIRAGGESSFDVLDISRPQPELHTDIPRLRAGGLGAQFWSVFVPAETEANGDAAHQTLEQIELVHRMVRRYPDEFELADTADDVLRIQRAGRIASMLGIEGGYSIEDSLSLLRTYYRLGVRYMTLTHANTTSWADSATDDPVHGGLSSFGEEVVGEMNRLGMLVDLSHVSAETMKDALRVSAAPVIFSHSSAYAVAPHARNVPDDVLALLPANGGVVMVNYFSGFVVPESARIMAQMFDVRRELRERFPADADFDREVATWMAANPIQAGTLSDLVDHIDHVVRVAGIDHVGLGSDYDGVSMLPAGLEDVSTYPAVTRELLARGYSEGDVRKVLGLNTLRALRGAEAVARDLAR